MIIYFGSKKQRKSIMLNLENIKQFLNKFNKRKLIKIRNIINELIEQ